MQHLHELRVMFRQKSRFMNRWVGIRTLKRLRENTNSQAKQQNFMTQQCANSSNRETFPLQDALLKIMVNWIEPFNYTFRGKISFTQHNCSRKKQILHAQMSFWKALFKN